MSNKALEDYLEKHKIKLLRSDVGDKYVLEVMKKTVSLWWRAKWTYHIFRCQKQEMV